MNDIYMIGSFHIMCCYYRELAELIKAREESRLSPLEFDRRKAELEEWRFTSMCMVESDYNDISPAPPRWEEDEEYWDDELWIETVWLGQDKSAEELLEESNARLEEELKYDFSKEFEDLCEFATPLESLEVEELVDLFNSSDKDGGVVNEFIRRGISVVDIQRSACGRPLKIWYDPENNAIHVRGRFFGEMDASEMELN